MTKQLTKSDKFAMLLEALETADVANKDLLVDFVSGEKALVEKRNATRAASRKPTKAQKENEGFVAEVVEFFSDSAEAGVAYTADEVAEAVGFEDFSAQKMTALMKKAVEEGAVEKIDKADSNKKKVGYKVAGSEKAESVEDEDLAEAEFEAEVEGDSLGEAFEG